MSRLSIKLELVDEEASTSSMYVVVVPLEMTGRFPTDVQGATNEAVKLFLRSLAADLALPTATTR